MQWVDKLRWKGRWMKFTNRTTYTQAENFEWYEPPLNENYMVYRGNHWTLFADHMLSYDADMWCTFGAIWDQINGKLYMNKFPTPCLRYIKNAALE